MANKAMTGMEVVFDRRQREFPSNTHRVAWYLGASMLPFARVVPKGLSQGEAEDLALGEKSLHEFFCVLYADMVQNPPTYLMTEAPDLVPPVLAGSEESHKRADGVASQDGGSPHGSGDGGVAGSGAAMIIHAQQHTGTG